MARGGARKVLRAGLKLLGGFAFLVFVLIALALLGVIWFGTPAGNRWLKGELERRVQTGLVEGEFTIGRLDTDVFGRLTLYDVKLTNARGEVVIGAPRAIVEYDVLPLLSRRADIELITLDGAVVDLVADERGLLNVQRMFGQTEPAPETDEPWAGLPIDFTAEQLALRGASIRYRDPGTDVWIEGANLVGAASGADTHIAFTELKFSGGLLGPARMPILASGGVAYTGNGLIFDDLYVWTPQSAATLDGRIDDLDTGGVYDLRADLQPLTLETIEAFTGEQGLQGAVRGQVRLQGPGGALRVDASLQGLAPTRGQLALEGVVDLTDEAIPWRATLTAQDLHVEELYDTKGTEIALNGTLQASGRGTSFPEDLTIEGQYTGAMTIRQDEQLIELDELQAGLTIDRGVLGFRDVQSRGPLGDLIAEGTLDLQSGELDVDLGGFLKLTGLQRLGVDDLLGQGDIDVRVRGNVFDEELRLDATGTASFRPFVYGEDIRFERLRAEFAWWMRGDTQHVDGVLDGTEGLVYDAEVARLEGTFDVELPPGGAVFVEGVARVEEFRYPDVLAAEWGELAYDVAVPPEEDASVEVRAAIELGPHLLLEEFPGTGGAAEIALVDDVLSYDVHLDDSDRPLLVARGTYGTESTEVRLAELLFSPTPRQEWRGIGEQTFTVVDGGLADASIHIASNFGRLLVEGRIATAGPLDGRILTEDLALDVFAELFPEQLSGLSGLLDLDLTAKGSATDPILAGDIDADALWLPGFSRWLDVQGEFGIIQQQATLDILIGAAGRNLAVIEGVVPLDFTLADPRIDAEGAIDLAVVLTPGALERLEWLSEEELGIPPGRVSAVLRAEGILRDPRFELTGVAEIDVPGWGDRGRIEFDIDRAGEGLEWYADVREGLQSRGRIVGTGTTRIGEALAFAFGDAPEPDWDDWTLYVDDVDTAVALLGTPVRSLLALAGDPMTASGELLGGFQITGSPLEPVISGGLNWNEARLGTVDLEGAFLAVVPTDGGYQLDLSVNFQAPLTEQGSAEPTAAGSLVVSGVVPLDIDVRRDLEDWVAGELALVVGGEGVPLDVLSAFDPGIEAAQGLLRVEGFVTGSPVDPDPDLTLTIADGSVEYAPLGVRYRDIRLEAAFDPDRVQLGVLSARTEPARQAGLLQLPTILVAELGAQDGTIVARGTARLENWEPRGSNFRVELDDAFVSHTLDTILQLDGSIVAQGDWPNLDVDGTLGVVQGIYVYDSGASLDAHPLELHSELAVHRGSPDEQDEEPAEAAEDEPPLYASFDVDVAIDLNRAMEVRASLPFIEDYGEIGAAVTTIDVVARLASRNLKVEIRGGELALLNEVEIVQGQVGVFRSLFDISGGALTFLGDPSNPLMDIAAEMFVTGGSVTLNIRGTPEDPEVAFFSEEYPDQTAILTILLTGQSPEQLTNEQAQGTNAALFGLLVNSVIGSVGEYSMTVDPDGRIRWGIPINRDVQAQFAVRPTPSPTENEVVFSIDARLLRAIVAQAAWGDEFSWVELFYEYRF